MTDRTVFAVFSNPVDGMDDEFNRWYDEQHVPDVVAVPGVSSAQRYTLAHPGPPGAPEPAHRYLVLYELDGDPDAVVKELASRFLTDAMPGSDALDMTSISMGVWAAQGQAVRSS